MRTGIELLKVAAHRLVLGTTTERADLRTEILEYLDKADPEWRAREARTPIEDRS